jgi:hypothetical protein
VCIASLPQLLFRITRWEQSKIEVGSLQDYNVTKVMRIPVRNTQWSGEGYNKGGKIIKQGQGYIDVEVPAQIKGAFGAQARIIPCPCDKAGFNKCVAELGQQGQSGGQPMQATELLPVSRGASSRAAGGAAAGRPVAAPVCGDSRQPPKYDARKYQLQCSCDTMSAPDSCSWVLFPIPGAAGNSGITLAVG